MFVRGFRFAVGVVLAGVLALNFSACDSRDKNIRAQSEGVLAQSGEIFVEFTDEFAAKSGFAKGEFFKDFEKQIAEKNAKNSKDSDKRNLRENSSDRRNFGDKSGGNSGDLRGQNLNENFSDTLNSNKNSGDRRNLAQNSTQNSAFGLNLNTQNLANSNLNNAQSSVNSSGSQILAQNSVFGSNLNQTQGLNYNANSSNLSGQNVNYGENSAFNVNLNTQNSAFDSNSNTQNSANSNLNNTQSSVNSSDTRNLAQSSVNLSENANFSNANSGSANFSNANSSNENSSQSENLGFTQEIIKSLKDSYYATNFWAIDATNSGTEPNSNAAANSSTTSNSNTALNFNAEPNSNTAANSSAASNFNTNSNTALNSNTNSNSSTASNSAQNKQIFSAKSGKILAKINGKESVVEARISGNSLRLNLPLKANSKYRVEFKILGVKVRLDFKTAPLKIALKSAKFEDDSDKSVFKASFESSFELGSEAFEGIELKLDKRNLKVAKTEKIGEIYAFESEKFAILDKNQNLKLTFKKRPFGLEKELNFDYISNAKNQLILQSVEAKEREIELSFNAALNEKQNAKDFIKIEPSVNFNAAIIGNFIKITGNFAIGQNYKITLMQGLLARNGTKTSVEISSELSFADLVPSLAFSSDGVFLSSEADKKIAFKSLNISKVKLKVAKIYANNISEYLRYKNLQGAKQMNSRDSEILGWNDDVLQYLGDVILEREFSIESVKNKWVQNEIKFDALKDLSGIFVLRLSFDEDSTDYDFSGLEEWEKSRFFNKNAEISKHLIFSNLALSAEIINDKIYANVRDFTTMGAQSGVKIEAINEKNQIIAFGMSDTNGEVLLENAKNAKFLIASKNDHGTILKLNSPLLTDGFDVSGRVESGEIQAFIYTERGVYRPGDKIHLNVVAKNSSGTINHPIHLTISDPRGKILLDKTRLEAMGDGMFYREIELEKSAPTGIYNASFDIGSEKFKHKILVQSIVPNRISVEIKAPEFIDINKNKKIDFSVLSKYLFGAPAANLKAQGYLVISKKPYKNKLYPNYIFDNPTLYIPSDNSEVDLKLDAQGVVNSSFEINERILMSDANFNAHLNVEVFESGGRGTQNALNLELRKFDYFVGIKRLENSYLNASSALSFDIIVSDLNEKLLKGKKLAYKIYKSNYSWWWDYDNFNEFIHSIKRDENSIIIASGEILSADKPVQIKFDSGTNFGDMLIEVTDLESGISAAQSFYISSWGEPHSANIQTSLKIKTDKPSYKPGQKAIVEFESVANAKAMVSLSNNEGLIKRFVLDTKDGKTEFSVDIEKNFAPNIYASVILLQDYNEWQNDRALRLFGVVPIMVENSETKLNLSLKTPEKILPQSEFEVEIQSSDKKPYTYTLAVVDEGLLSLTNFKTPDIWGAFFAKIGFKLQVFDTYDKIIAKTFGAVQKILETGGEAALGASAKSKQDENADRFKPVVLYTKPIKSNENGFAKVKFTMPSYMGSVRVMAVASSSDAFGSASKNVLVNAPVIMLETLPRALRIGDEFKLLVQVFKIDKDVKSATLNVKSKNSLLKIANESVKIDFSNNATQNVYFDVKVNDEILGIEELEFELLTNRYTYKSTSEIDVKAQNTYTYESESFILKAGESREFSVDKDFVKGSTTAILKISPTPILNIDKRLNFLLRYPYGCIEQTTSAVLPQLYLDKFSLKANKQKIINNINAAIARYANFQTPDGGFAYWQGGREADIWGSNYAGMFLLLAKDAGYFVPQNLLNRYKFWAQNFVKKNSLNRTKNLYYQANTLFLLALAKEPNLSAMNVLYEKRTQLDSTSLWQLAAAYKLAGNADIALKIAQSVGVEPNLPFDYYDYYDETYGSIVRDKAIIANAYKIIYEKNHPTLLNEIIGILQSNEYLSTQSAGYALYALAFALNLGDKTQGEAMSAVLNLNGKVQNFTQNELQIIEFSDGKASLSTRKDLFASFGVEGIRLNAAPAHSNKLSIKRSFLDENGKPLDESKIQSSKAFYMKLEVMQTDYGVIRNIALTQVLPSGWEVASDIMSGGFKPSFAQGSEYDFIDIRDDKIMWFFDLHSGIKESFIIKLNAVTPGTYTLTGAFAEAMYDDSFSALSESKKVVVSE